MNFILYMILAKAGFRLKLFSGGIINFLLLQPDKGYLIQDDE
jgi:hypothetical protein